jgi:hypothetical protein
MGTLAPYIRRSKRFNYHSLLKNSPIY